MDNTPKARQNLRMDIIEPNFLQPEIRRFQFATLHTVNNGPLLAADAVKDAFLTALTDTRNEFRLVIGAYVILDNHVHILYGLPYDHSNIPALNHLRGNFVRIWRKSGTSTDDVRVWSRHAESRAISNSRDLRAHLDYIHSDPVTHGIVKRAADYPWSSLPARIAQGHYPHEWARLGPPAGLAQISRIS